MLICERQKGDKDFSFLNIFIHSLFLCFSWCSAMACVRVYGQQQCVCVVRTIVFIKISTEFDVTVRENRLLLEHNVNYFKQDVITLLLSKQFQERYKKGEFFMKAGKDQ